MQASQIGSRIYKLGSRAAEQNGRFATFISPKVWSEAAAADILNTVLVPVCFVTNILSILCVYTKFLFFFFSPHFRFIKKIHRTEKVHSSPTQWRAA